MLRRGRSSLAGRSRTFRHRFIGCSPEAGLGRRAIALFLALAVLICFTGWVLNWYLSLASIFVVRNGEDGLGALSAAVSFSRGASWLDSRRQHMDWPRARCC